MKTYLEEFEEKLAKIDAAQLLRDCLEECYREAAERRQEALKYQLEDDMYGCNFHQGYAAGSQNIEMWLREMITKRSKAATK